MAERRAAVLSHQRPAETGPALMTLIGAARAAGVTLCLTREEADKHGLAPDGEGVSVVDGAEQLADVEMSFVLGGDGSILTALRRYAGTGIPTIGVNFGELGFLATLEPEEVADGFTRAFSGDFERLRLPTIGTGPGEEAVNDISLHREPGARVAHLAYAVGEQEIGRVRCDGLVVSTPAGSTGYNLANGGPVMAWGVEGMVVSFIAPHSLTARALVAAPSDVLVVSNLSREEAVELALDGRPTRHLAPGRSLQVEFHRDRACLAQIPGTSFYARLREKFGKLTGL